MTATNKDALKTELASLLAADLDTLEKAHKATREGATHPDAKPENDKDTRALEQTYLARGQAMRIEELRAAVADVESMPLRPFTGESPAALGAVITIDEDGDESRLFLAPAGGGNRLADGAVQVVTPRSPLGQALLGKREGDDVEVRLAGKTRALSILRVE